MDCDIIAWPSTMSSRLKPDTISIPIQVYPPTYDLSWPSTLRPTQIELKELDTDTLLVQENNISYDQISKDTQTILDLYHRFGIITYKANEHIPKIEFKTQTSTTKIEEVQIDLKTVDDNYYKRYLIKGGIGIGVISMGVGAPIILGIKGLVLTSMIGISGVVALYNMM